MGLRYLALPLSEDESVKRRRGRRRRSRRPRTENNPPKGNGTGAKSEEIERALARFTVNPRPMGIPKEINPPPEKVENQSTSGESRNQMENKSSRQERPE